MRRLLLLSAKNSVIIRMLSQQVETIRRHKNEKLLELKDVLAELDQDVNELKQMMPSKNVSSLGVDIEPSRKFTHATPAPVTADDKLEQIEEMQLKKQLENELERIEGKLESL